MRAGHFYLLLLALFLRLLWRHRIHAHSARVVAHLVDSWRNEIFDVAPIVDYLFKLVPLLDVLLGYLAHLDLEVLCVLDFYLLRVLTKFDDLILSKARAHSWLLVQIHYLFLAARVRALMHLLEVFLCNLAILSIVSVSIRFLALFSQSA